ncbi:MAG: hypothetical protein E6K01_07115 [Methanobacteriota archaeon]|nr:MAG: hypothetical protein E6K01_07115 [Euryarchaeota archaeon]
MSGYRTRERRSAAREFAIVSLAGLASFLFLNHENLRASKAVSRDDVTTSARDLENVSSRDLVAAIDDPDLLERLRHSPNPPRDPRLKR